MEVQAPADDGARYLLRLFAEGLRPDPRRSTAEWAAAERIVSEGAYQGRWRHERTPYLTEMMERVSLHCPTRRITILGSAQIGKTQVGVNLLGQILAETPAQALVLLPSLTSLGMYNRDKLDRMIRGTPALSAVVADVVERAGQSSTTRVKIGARGAQVELLVASSSKDLQSRTARVVIAEETSEYDTDVGGRGSPFEQAVARTIQWRKRGEKVVEISTPGIKGRCHVTAEYEKGSGGRFLVRCPHCDHPQELTFAQLRWPAGEPDKAEYQCEAAECGVLWQERDKPRLLASGRWVHDKPQLLDRHASYRLNTLYSYFTPWADFAAMAEKASADPSLLKTFHQQWIGQAWDEAHDLPKAEILLMRRQPWKPGSIPPGVLFLVGATDVQGDRLEWGVWGFDRNFGQWRIDGGVLPGDPTQDIVWQAHTEVMGRRWMDAWGREVRPCAWGIDSGYLPRSVYSYVTRYAHRDHDRLSYDQAQSGNFPVRALDGRAGWRLPPIGTPSLKAIDWSGRQVKIRIYPVGTWDMKSELASALRLTEQGPGPEGWPRGALHFNEAVDRAWLDELLGERFVENPRTGARSWQKIGKNEAWDIAVYARAQARAMAMMLTDAEWDGLAARTQGKRESAQADLLEFAAPMLAPPEKPAVAPHVAAHHLASAGRRIVGTGRSLR
jgi:phage terminase large subunit GpA-like protein